jgi:hypothetical protein
MHDVLIRCIDTHIYNNYKVDPHYRHLMFASCFYNEPHHLKKLEPSDKIWMPRIFWKIWFGTSCADGLSMKQRRWTLLLFPYSSPTLPYRNCHHYIFLCPLLIFAKKLMGGFSSTCRSWETHMEAAEETLALINTLLPMIGPQRLDFHATSIHPVAAPLAWCSL